MTERDERGKKMFEPRRISRRARDRKACRTAAAKRARRVLFPRTAEAIFQLSDISRELSFGIPFSFAGKEKGDSGRTVRASLLARTVLPAVFFRYKQRVYPGCRVENRVSPYQVRDDKRRVFPGSRIKCGMTGWPHRGRLGKLKKEIIKRRGMSLPKVRQTKAGISGYRIKVRDDWETASGAIG